MTTHPTPTPRTHRADPDPLMAQADGMTRCTCGRLLAEVGTIQDRHWLHVEEPWAAQAAPDAALREDDLDMVLSLVGPDALARLQRHGFTVAALTPLAEEKE